MLGEKRKTEQNNKHKVFERKRKPAKRIVMLPARRIFASLSLYLRPCFFNVESLSLLRALVSVAFKDVRFRLAPSPCPTYGIPSSNNKLDVAGIRVLI